jgi:hypothetical protein
MQFMLAIAAGIVGSCARRRFAHVAVGHAVVVAVEVEEVRDRRCPPSLFAGIAGVAPASIAVGDAVAVAVAIEVRGRHVGRSPSHPFERALGARRDAVAVVVASR